MDLVLEIRRAIKQLKLKGERGIRGGGPGSSRRRSAFCEDQGGLPTSLNVLVSEFNHYKY